MLIKVRGETSEPFVSGDAIAQVVDGGLNAVVGSEEAKWKAECAATDHAHRFATLTARPTPNGTDGPEIFG